MELTNGQMMLFMKVNGGIIRRMEKELFGILVVTFISENFLMIRHTALEFTFIRMEADMKETGFMMFNKAKVKKSGSTEQAMLAIIRMV